MAAGDDRGRFCWHELMAREPAAVTPFYRDVVGWGTKAMNVGGSEYTLWTRGEQPVAGLMALPEEAAGAPPHWLGYVWVPDVDATARQASELDATLLVRPRDIPEIGRFAVLRDPQGAVIALFNAPEPMPTPEREAEPQEFSWNELSTTHLDAALDFYGRLFGWEKHAAVHLDRVGLYQMFGRPDGPTLGAMFVQSQQMPEPPTAWLHYVRVPSVDAAIAEVERLGGRVCVGPIEVPGGDRIVQCNDPEGASFALHEVRP
jgi:hypothetical protein